MKPARHGVVDASLGMPKGTPLWNWMKLRRAPEIEMRARSHEKRGHSRDEARALAEIEYYRTGLK